MIEYTEIKYTSTCCMCEHGVFPGQKAVIVASRRSTRNFVLHPECVTAMKDFLDKELEEEKPDGSA